MRAPARVWRCEPPAGPSDLAPLTSRIRTLLTTRHATPLEQVLAMTPAEYAQALFAYNQGPDPKDEDAPLTAEEQALVDAQGDRIERDPPKK